MRACILLGLVCALFLAGAAPALSAGEEIKEYTVVAELKGSSVKVECKIIPLLKGPLKKLSFEARQAGGEKIADVAISVNGTPVPLKVTNKEHDWAGKHVYSYVIDQELQAPVNEGETLTLSYVVNDVQTPGYVQVPLFVPPWKLTQEGVAFNGSLNLPSGSYYQGRSFPVSRELLEESNGVETIRFTSLNLPTGLYASVGPKKAGFFTWGNNWTIFMFSLILAIAILYLRYEIRYMKGGSGR
jgi:hypothetical protein